MQKNTICRFQRHLVSTSSARKLLDRPYENDNKYGCY